MALRCEESRHHFAEQIRISSKTTAVKDPHEVELACSRSEPEPAVEDLGLDFGVSGSGLGGLYALRWLQIINQRRPSDCFFCQSGVWAWSLAIAVRSLCRRLPTFHSAFSEHLAVPTRFCRVYITLPHTILLQLCGVLKISGPHIADL